MYEIRPETVKSFITDRNVDYRDFKESRPGTQRKIFNYVLAYLKNILLGFVY